MDEGRLCVVGELNCMVKQSHFLQPCGFVGIKPALLLGLMRGSVFWKTVAVMDPADCDPQAFHRL